jgi:hypothetical protein
MRRRIALLILVAAFSCTTYPRLEPGDPPPVALLAPPPAKARAECVILISIDGCRPDAIEAANARTLQGLIGRGAFTADAETIRPSLTLPSHTSMLTGLDFDRHGVVWNNYRSGYIVHPTLFSVVTQVGKSAAMFFSKDKFHFLANPACVSWIYGPPVPDKVPAKEDFTDVDQLKLLLKREDERARKESASPHVVSPQEASTTAEKLARAFSSSWPGRKWALTFIHFRELDEVGHRRGWMGPEYLSALQTVDRAIGEIVGTIEQNGGFEKTALIVTADHGGKGYGHYNWLWPNIPENVRIPWICVGPGIPAGLHLSRPLRTYDTAPTALALIGVGAPEGIDGTAVEEVLK